MFRLDSTSSLRNDIEFYRRWILANVGQRPSAWARHSSWTGWPRLRLIGANSLAWAAGMLVIFSGMDFIRWNGPRLLLAVGACLMCGLAGLVVGAIHGRLLVGLTLSVETS